MTTTAQKTVTLTADQFHRGLMNWSHGAARTWSEIVGAWVGVGSAFERDEEPELSTDEEAAVEHINGLIDELYQVGRVTLENAPDLDYRYQLIAPVEV